MTQINWSKYPEYDNALRSHAADGLTAKQIAERLLQDFGLVVTQNQVSGRLTRLGAGTAGGPAPDTLSTEERFERAVASERQKAADRAFAREMAAAVRGQARWDEFLDIVRGEIATMPPFEVPQPIFLASSNTPETMAVHITDPHVGKLVDPTVVGDTFGYGSAIFEARLARLTNRIIRFFELHSANAPIDKLVIFFTGDGVDGVDMRRGHPHRVDIQTATQQVLVLVQAMTSLTASLRLALGVPVHWEWRYGNHGRVGEFGVNLPSDNWDYMAGKMLETTLASIPLATINVPTTPGALTKLGPLTVYSAHGNGGKRGSGGHFGIPLNGIAANAVADMGIHQQLIDLFVIGHWHQTMDNPLPLGGRVLMSSAWDGGDDFSINNLKAASEPEQWAFGVHPERGITWQSRIQLAPRRRPTEVF